MEQKKQKNWVDNNRAERAIKPLVIGRKNRLCVSRRRSYGISGKAA
ncbi:IS66 family transposase [Vibrio jasicida]